MNNYYEQIMSLRGLEDYKREVECWRYLALNMTTAPAERSVIMPDMLWIANSGVGKTYLLKLAAEYLSSNSVMEFYGDVKYFEFFLEYCEPNSNFSELPRLTEAVRNAAGFRSEYRGIVCIEATEWLGHCNEKHFINLMEYLSVNSDKWLVIFSVTEGDEDRIDELESMISVYLRLKKIHIRVPETDALFEYMSGKLSEYGLETDESAKQVLCQTIDVLRTNKYFDGYKTIKLLYQDIVYDVYSSSLDSKLLSAQMLKKYSSDSEYVKKTIYKSKKHKIGFNTGREEA